MRERLQVSQAFAADRAGRDREWWVKVENARRGAPRHVSTHEALAKGLGVPFLSLYQYLTGHLTLDEVALQSEIKVSPEATERRQRYLPKAKRRAA